VKWNVYTVDETIGECFDTLVEALQHMLTSIEQCPLSKMYSLLEKDNEKSEVNKLYYSDLKFYLYKIANIETGEIIWEEPLV